jgi:epoxyqueuosine reductase
MNESGGEFPEWLPAEVHHTIYDCLRCQEGCPMNAAVSKNKIGPVCFSEEETVMLLAGKGSEDFPEEFRRRADSIGLFYWRDGLPRNIRAIMHLQKD